MGTGSSEFEEKLLATFRVEAQEHIDAIISGLIELEKPAGEEQYRALLETTFRETHSFKGAARSVNLPDIEETCQALEDVFSSAKREEILLTSEVFDTLHETISTLEILLKGLDSQKKAALKKSRELVNILEKISEGITGFIPRKEEGDRESEPEALLFTGDRGQTVSPIRGIQSDTVRLSVDQLNSLMLQAEELGDAKRAAAQRAEDLKILYREFLPWKQRWGRVNTRLMVLRRSGRDGHIRKCDIEEKGIEKFTGFLDYNADFVQNIESTLVREKSRARIDHQFLREKTDTYINDLRGLLMMPAGSILGIFPRFVRDFSRDNEKEVELDISGSDIVIDRRILEEIKDAFIHLIRNAIDHGIEKPDTRMKKGKKPAGRIAISFSLHEENRVAIFFSDDGTGVNPARIREAALKCGAITQEDYNLMDDVDILPLIYHSGLTTSPIITDTSGRGLGLAIVMEKVNKIGGTISIETVLDKGTSFRILIPSRLSAFKGLVVHEKGQSFVLPLRNVEQAMRISPASLKSVGSQDVFLFHDEEIPLVELGNILGIPRKTVGGEDQAIYIVVIFFAGKRLGISVEELGYVQEVMIKEFGGQLEHVRAFTGAAVLRNGKVVPVLRVGDLINTSIRQASGGIAPNHRSDEKVSGKRRSVLVTEDSITSRMLLKNILESEGYTVETAVDGVDAFSKLRTGLFDIVVSDVDMPRMNGFVLTEKIRSDKKLSDIPVVLVTALDSQRDRERGIDAGADAYIVKASFDQSNLIEVVRKLVGR